MRTVAPFSITQSTAGSGGYDIDALLTITEKGIVWEKGDVIEASTPYGHPQYVPASTVNQSSITTSDKSNFVAQLVALSPNTKYYVRSYVVVDGIAQYGTEFSFVTRSVSDGEAPETCDTFDIDIHPGEVYNLPPLSSIVSVDATETEARAIKASCSDVDAIFEELRGNE